VRVFICVFSDVILTALFDSVERPDGIPITVLVGVCMKVGMGA